MATEYRASRFPWHSAADASRPAALLVGQIFPIFSLLAPGGTGASAPLVRHRNYEMDHLGFMRDDQRSAEGVLEPLVEIFRQPGWQQRH